MISSRKSRMTLCYIKDNINGAIEDEIKKNLKDNIKDCYTRSTLRRISRMTLTAKLAANTKR